MEQHIAALNQQIASQEDEIQQLRIELLGASEAAQAAQAAAAEARANMLPRVAGDPESILKSLQTPQIIRDLPSFDGNPIKLHSFIRAIDSLMPTINRAVGTDCHQVWIQAIRTKVVGEADNILELYGTNLNWADIKQNLITHYSDRRDEVSLTRDLFAIHQVSTVEEFYSKISHVVSLLVNLLNISEEHTAVKAAKNNFYQQLGLKVFLGGLKDPLGPIIRAQVPTNLKDALRLCIEESNYSHTRNKPFGTPPPIPQKPNSSPQWPIKPFNNRPQFPPFSQKPILFPPQRPFQFTQQRPFPFQQPRFQFPQQRPFPFPPQGQFQNPQQRPFPFPQRAIQNPQPKPTPMEVDNSIRSRQINYMNRPHFQIEEFPTNCDDSYSYDPNEYYYYDNYNQQYQTAYENTNEPPPVEAKPQNLEFNQETDSKEAEIDDLNFHQVAADFHPT